VTSHAGTPPRYTGVEPHPPATTVLPGGGALASVGGDVAVWVDGLAEQPTTKHPATSSASGQRQYTWQV
jgi:hypothetical protein